MLSRNFYKAAGMALACVWLCALAARDAAAQDDTVFTVGVGLPLSGPAASTGQVFTPGFEAAVKLVNSAGLLKGKIQAAFEDNQCAPAPTVTAVQKFVSIDHVATMTVVCSSAMLAAAPAAERNEVPLINPSALSPAMASIGDYVISLNPLLIGELPPALAYASEKLGVKTIALVYSAEALGKASVAAVNRVAPTLGMTVVGTVSVDPTKTSDFSGQAATLRSMQPDAVYVAMVGGAEAVLTAIRDAGIKPQIVSSDLFSNTPQMAKLSAAQGAIYAVPSFNLESSDPITKGFVHEFAASNGGAVPNAGQVEAANTIVLSAQLIGKLQQEGKPITGANMIDLAKRTKQFDLIGGPTTIKYPGAYTVNPIAIIKIEDQAIKTVHIYSADEVAQLQSKGGP